jgi:2-oxoglutarate ferredoxin oxidoreductase subunit gamma
MLERILIAGSGGQGVLMIGKLLAGVALHHVEHVTFFPSYGAEVRGGTSHCQIILSSRKIASPVSEVFDSLIILNQASVESFLSRRTESARVLLNASLCRAEASNGFVMIDAQDQANRLGLTRVANVIMLGAYVAGNPLIPATSVEEAIRTKLAHAPNGLLDVNLKAFQTGMGMVDNNRL